MAAIDELIATYLTACEVEGKTANTVIAYRATQCPTSTPTSLS